MLFDDQIQESPGRFWGINIADPALLAPSIGNAVAAFFSCLGAEPSRQWQDDIAAVAANVDLPREGRDHRDAVAELRTGWHGEIEM
jgi:hypothetical protein